MYSQPEEGEKVLDSRGPAEAQGLRPRQCPGAEQCFWRADRSEEIMSNEAGKEAGARSLRASVSCRRGDIILTQGRGQGHGGWEGGRPTIRVIVSATTVVVSSSPHF